MSADLAKKSGMPRASESQDLATARLDAAFCHQNGRTRLEHLFCAAPLKIARPFPFRHGENNWLSVMVMDASPGLLAGDNYKFAWQIGAGATVHLTTQGFTRVHPSLDNPSAISNRIEVENGARLEWFPEPLMLFEGANLRQQTEIDLGETAIFLAGEIVCAGRIGREIGEAFRFHSFENRLKIRRGGGLIFASQTRTCPAEFDPRALGAWDGFTHSGSFQVFAPGVDASWPDKLRAAIETQIAANPALQKANALHFGVSSLEDKGTIVSLLGRLACDLQSVIFLLRGVVAKLFAASLEAV